MKNKIFTSATSSLLLVLFFLQVHAQGPPAAIYMEGLTMNAGNTRFCDLSDPVPYGAVLKDSLTNEGDSVIFTFYFGDGDSAVYSAICDSTDLIEFEFPQYSHQYATSGVYTLTGKAEITNSNRTVYSIINQTFYLGSYCGLVRGLVYNDCNLNCNANNQEPKFQNVKVIHSDANGNRIDSTYTNQYGNYSFNIQVGEVYKLHIEAPNSMIFTYVCPVNGIYNDTVFGDNDIRNFSVFYNAGAQDLIANVGSSTARPGRPIQVRLLSRNSSCSPITNTFSTLHINTPLLTFDTAFAIAPTSITSSTITWSGNTIPANSTQTIWVTLLVDSTAQMGDTLCFTYTVGPDSVYTTNNQVNHCVVVVNSFDPNLKVVLPVGAGSQGYIPQETEFTYTIHFQNLGNAPAFDITVLDSIESNLDINTYHAISSSHSYYTIMHENVIEYKFMNINLPDSASSPVESNGSITFKIKAKPNLLPGTQIRNKAYVYFDLNSPVITNSTLNTIEILTALQENNGIQGLHVYPNPSDGLIRIISSTEIKNCRIIDITGRIVFEKNFNAQNTVDLDLRNLEHGVYFVQTLNHKHVISQSKWIKH